MTKLSEHFEKQIERIHHLIEQPGSEVTWNDHITDPDNPIQQRQIDITIKREGSLSLVECRIHKEAQDVTWVEQLIGRRISLKADTVIGVSHSGFTRGAVEKAKNHGVILRDFQTLTEEEIKRWGFKTRVFISYHNFANFNLSFLFSGAAKNIISREDLLHYLISEANFYKLLDIIMKEIDKNKPELFAEKKLNCFEVQFAPKDEKITGFQIKEILFNANYKLVNFEAKVPSIVAYDGPGVEALERMALVEKVDLGNFEITQSCNDVSVAVDFNQLGIPVNSHIRDITFDFIRPVRMKLIEILSQPKLFVPISKITINLRFEKEV
jgi:hypothetical protein